MDVKLLPGARQATPVPRPSVDPDALLSQNRDRLFNIAYAWCKDAALADDIVQDTLIKAVQRIDQLKHPDCHFSWMCSILSNCLNDHYRRRKGIEPFDELTEDHIDAAGQIDRDPALICLSSQISRIVQRVVRDLPIQQRRVLSLVDLEEYSYSEAAIALGIPIGTVMSRLARARHSLRKKLLPLK